jgi:hypothetical protein
MTRGRKLSKRIKIQDYSRFQQKAVKNSNWEPLPNGESGVMHYLLKYKAVKNITHLESMVI